MTNKKSTRLSKAQVAFLQEEDAKRAVQSLDDRMELEFEYQQRQVELDRREQEIHAAAQADQYRARRISEEQAAKTLASQFVDYIAGSTPDEVEASIQMAMSKTAEIQAEIQQAQQKANQPRDQFGRFRAEPGEPEIDFTRLSYNEFVRNRDQLIGRAIDKGLFN